MVLRMTRHRRAHLAAIALATVALAACSSRGANGSSTSASDSSPSGSNAAASDVLGTPQKATGTPIKIGFVNDGKTAQIDSSGSWLTAEATAKYANDYLNGINGHVIELDHCETAATPSGGTACGAQFAKDKVAAVLSGVSVEDTQVSKALGMTIPYLATSTGAGDMLTAPSYRYVIQNPLGQMGAQMNVSAEKQLKKVALVLIDVPSAATAGAIATPIYAKAGQKLDSILIPASVADHTSRIQQAINSGDQSFAINGTTAFFIADLKALRQLKFDGPIVVNVPTQAQMKQIASAVPGGMAGVINETTQTDDPNDADVKLYNAVVSKYVSGDLTGDGIQTGFISVLTLVRALEGKTAAVDASTVNLALSKMDQIKLPLGGGITAQCGQNFIAILPGVCSTQYLLATLNADGSAASYAPGDIKPYL
jgi:branched-chain amino acid transport system substrate-binding protein